MAQTPLRIGLLGAGTIATSNTGYLPGLAEMRDQVATVAIADVAVDRARTVAARFGIPAVYGSVDELLHHDGLDAVVNITPIPFHGDTSRQILAAGKHLGVEKPIDVTLAAADRLIEAARAAGVIGQPCFARVRSSHGGPAAGAWPLDPTWFYQEGSGPLLDMGVYGIHDITGILGPAKRVVAFSGITEPVRTVRAGPFAGTKITVTADDNTLLMLDFGNATFAVVDGTFNVNAAKSPQIEIFGRSGTINLNNQTADGSPPLEVFRFDAVPGIDGWITPRGGMGDSERQRYRRAILVKHLADCIATGTPPVASAEHARHALEIMVKAIESARSGQALELQTTF